MRAAAVATFALVVLAGCTSPVEEPAEPEGPADLTGASGIMLVDASTRNVVLYSEASRLAWMSENATLVTWAEETFAIIHDRSTGAREVAPLTVWARIHDNGTGLELAPGVARVKDIVGGTVRSERTLPPAPREDAAWSDASDDLRVLGAEYPRAERASCANDIFLGGEAAARTLGCHLRVAADGRAGWTEATGVRVRGLDGVVENVTGPGSGDPSNGTFVAHENPVFTSDGVLMLRITGGSEIVRTEVVSEDGTVLATMDGPRRLALLDASADARYLLVRAFER